MCLFRLRSIRRHSSSGMFEVVDSPELLTADAHFDLSVDDASNTYAVRDYLPNPGAGPMDGVPDVDLTRFAAPTTGISGSSGATLCRRTIGPVVLESGSAGVFQRLPGWSSHSRPAGCGDRGCRNVKAAQCMPAIPSPCGRRLRPWRGATRTINVPGQAALNTLPNGPSSPGRERRSYGGSHARELANHLNINQTVAALNGNPCQRPGVCNHAHSEPQARPRGRTLADLPHLHGQRADPLRANRSLT